MLNPSYEGVNLELISACQSAFMIWLKKNYSRFSSNPLTIHRTDTIEDLKSFTYQNGPPIFPYAVMAPAGVQLNTDFGGLRQRFAPIELGKNIQKRQGRYMTATPVHIGMGFEFRTDDTQEVDRFLTLIYSTAPGPSLSLQMPDTGFTIQCRATYPADLDFPIEKNEDGEYTKISLSVVMNSWIGQFYDTGLIANLELRILDDTNTILQSLTYDPDTKQWSPEPFLNQTKTQTSSYQTDSWTYTSRGE